MPFLQVEGLTKSFGGLTAVHNLPFQVEEGEIIGLIGPNGSGKTTLLNLITGFLKADSGAIRFAEKPYHADPRSEAADNVQKVLDLLDKHLKRA